MINLNIAEYSLILIVFLLTTHYFIFLIIVYNGLKKLQPIRELKLPNEFVSVIVPFRNEIENIENNYHSLINQNYPIEKFEIIFVNDNSTDNSFNFLSNLNNAKNVKVISVPKDYSPSAHKKRAIRFGIENSQGEIIVTTDADCIHNQNWLRNILSYFDEQTAFVAGPVEFIDDYNLFSKMQKIEFTALVIVGAGLIGANKPTICNAANIAYRKKVFYQVDGFLHNMNLSSGDDELLMQKIFQDTDYKIKFAASKNAIVKTYANKNIHQFYQQRKRWASKGLFYKNKLLILKLIFIYLFYLLMLLQPILGLFSNLFFITFSFSIFVKITIEFIILKKGVDLLFEKKILKYFFITQLFHIPYIVIMGLAGALGNYLWKNRKLKR